MRAAGWSRLSLPVLLVAYLALAVLYDFASPIYEASDEFRHFLALHSIVATGQLPVLAPSDDPLTPGVEAGQPPLYYLLGGALSGWVNIGELPGVDFNPHVQEGVPSTDPDNKNLFVHSPAESFPYQGLSLAVHLVRLVSILCGAGTVWLTYRLAQAVAPGLPPAAPLAASLVAFNPQFLFISASIDNDNLITVASAAALLLMVCVLGDGPKDRRLWALSAVLGVAMLSKLSGLALPALAVLTIALATRPWNWQVAVRRVLILAVGPVAIAGWWYVRNWLTYGEPTGLSGFLRIYGGERGQSLLGLLREAPGLFISYWGVFGGFDIKGDDWLYWLYLALTVGGLVGLLLARQRVAKVLPGWRPVWLLVLWFGLELAALIRWTSITTASTGRLLFPAIAAVSVLLAIGLLAPFDDGVRHKLASGLSSGLFALAVFVPFRYLMPAYAAPVIARSPVGSPSHQLDIIYGDLFDLAGYDLQPEGAKPGDEVRLDLYWRVLRAPDRNYAASVQLLSGEGTLGQYDSLPGEGRIATRRLQAGDYFQDRYRVRVDSKAPAPIIARLIVAVYDDQLGRLAARNSAGGQLTEPVLAELPIDLRTAEEASAETPLASFGGQMALLSATLPDAPVTPGGAFEVDLRWQALQRMSQGYTVFVHLADDSGRVVAQQDQQPRGGAFPTTWWAMGETVDDSLRLTVAPGTARGRYQVLLGVYELGSLQRLPASTGGDSVRVGFMEVA